MLTAIQDEPRTIDLRFGGSSLRISLRPEVKAEEIGSRNRITRVWPRGRLLRAISGGDHGSEGSFQSSVDWVLPTGCTWEAIFPNVGRQLMALVARFQSHQWPMLEFAQNHKPFRDILQSNPVLAYVMACNDEFRNTTPDFAARRAIGYSERKQREIVALLGFPATESTVKLFRLLLPEAVNPPTLRLLRRALPFTGKLAKIIAHADKINAGVLAFLIYPVLRDRLTSRLLREIAATPEEMASAKTADLVLDTLRMGEGIRQWKGLPELTSRARAKEVHDCTLLEHLADQERLRREREERAARQRELERQEEARRRRILHERYILAREEARIARERLTERLKSSKLLPGEVFPDPPIPGTSTIVPILSVPDLTIEGIEQQNCAASRASEIRRGRQYIYRVLSPQRATLAMTRGKRGWALTELKLKANAPASKQTFAAVQQWLEEHQAIKRPQWDDTPF